VTTIQERVIGGSIRTVGAVSPRAGAALALPVFMSVGRGQRMAEDAAPTMERARRSTVRIDGLDRNGVDVRVYEWGAGADVVVLAHGWRGRASQFATLVRDLVFEGFRVVAFDAPGHGETPGRATYLFDWTDALVQLQRRYGLFHGIVGHSFGALAALVAVSGGVAARRVVTVAAPADADTLLSQFSVLVGFGHKTAAALRARFATRFFPGEDDPFPRISAAEQPLPETTELLVLHDRSDRVVPISDLDRLAAANPHARVVITEGLGHNRILAADRFLDETVDFLVKPSSVDFG